MQRTDLLIQHRDVTPEQHGAARRSTVPSDTYKFPYTPQQRERKLTANTHVQYITPDSFRAAQRASATENAYTRLKQQAPTSTPAEVKAYAQWIMQADQLLEVMRQKAQKGAL